MWQDYVFASGGAFFAAATIPMLRNRDTVIPRSSSVPTALFLWVFVVTHYSLDLYWASATESLSASMWTALVFLRGPR